MNAQRTRRLFSGAPIRHPDLATLRPRPNHSAWRWIPRDSRVFVNRNLRMESIAAIGFDLDHTLAHYDPHPVEQLAFEATLQKLVEGGHFPDEILSIRYRPDHVIRGLVMDRRRGNLLKMDYFNYVRRAFHGDEPVHSEERKRMYRHRRVRLSAEAYASTDTLFHLPEAYLYQMLVDVADRREAPNRPDYEALYDLVRKSIDRAHADGSIKNVIMAEPERHLRPDPDLRTVLDKLRQSGKKLFLLTNSEYFYTDSLLSFLIGDGKGDKPPWQESFDLIVTDAGKPAFFTSRQRRGVSERRVRAGGKTFTVYEGGHAGFLQQQLGFWGDQVLYFGDHTYGDILRSKKSLGWRTAMIVPELAHELAVTQSLQRELVQLAETTRERSLLEMKLAMLEQEEQQLASRRGPAAPKRRSKLKRDRERLRAQVKILETEQEELEDRCDAAYNPRWGSLFREGRETSRFGHQVKDFACIYMSRVTCLLHYPTNHYFQSPESLMPHEL